MRIFLRTAACLAIGLLGCKGKDRAESGPNPALVELARTCTRGAEISCPRPIFTVRDLRASQRYYRDALGFQVDWEYGDPPDFGSVSRADAVLFLAQSGQEHPGAWIMLFVRDVDRLYEELAHRKALIKMPPTNMPWGVREMHVADLDGNMMRFGSALEH
jgi:catechol 2,3-dioxygenase-like lactoylglutathione lyase family enzyme